MLKIVYKFNVLTLELDGVVLKILSSSWNG